MENLDKKFIGSICIIVLALLIGAFSITRGDIHTHSKYIHAQQVSYMNQLHAFRIWYQKGGEVSGTDDDILLRSVNRTVPSLEARSIIVNKPYSQETIQQIISDSVKMLCTEDSFQNNTFCTKVTSLEPFVSDEGTSGFVFYTEGTEEKRGPWFVFPEARANNDIVLVFIFAPATVSTADIDSVLLEQTARSFSFQTVQGGSGSLSI